jgi:hypothetical protein
MTRRGAALAVLAVVALVGVAGCVDSRCGPGETAIENVAVNATDEVTVEGTIAELSESRIVLDDGTGQALLVAIEGYDTSTASEGDCAVATGTVVDPSTSAEYDVVLRTSSVRVEQG